MWNILLGMISTNSLAAFSAALAPGIAAASRAMSPAAPAATAARATSLAAGAAPGSAGSITPPVLRPGQILPRGSVLNLCV